jgi:plastocyanin
MTPDGPGAASTATRRAVVRRAAGASALLALPFAGLAGARFVAAQDDDGGDHSGSGGHGRGRGRGRGGGGEDAPEAGAVAGGPATTAGPGDVTIVGRAFQPATLTVAPGQTVTWRNQSDDDHTATGAAFDTGVIPPGGTGVATFANAGSFPYQCNFHPEMQGVIVVADGAGATAAAPQAAEPAADATVDLAGVWRVRLEAADFGPYEGLATFHPDGALAATLVGTADAAPSSPVLGPAQGVWEPAGDDYRLTMVALLLDDAGRFAGAATIRETGRVEPTGDAYAGSFQGDIAGTDGGARRLGPGTTAGQRIRIDAAPPAANEPAAAATDSDAAATPAASGAAFAARAASEVAIRDFAFDPATLEVAVGTTVTWRNGGVAPHTSTATDGGFDTGRIDPGQNATATFDQPGTFAYRCAFHPNMEGEVVVR